MSVLLSIERSEPWCRPCRQKFVLQVLSDTAVFIKRAKEDWLKVEITQWQQAISYENAEFKT